MFAPRQAQREFGFLICIITGLQFRLLTVKTGLQNRIRQEGREECREVVSCLVF